MVVSPGDEPESGKKRTALGHTSSPWPAFAASAAFSLLYLVLRDSFVMFGRGMRLAEAALQGPEATDNLAAFGRASAAALQGLQYYWFSAACAVVFALWALRGRPKWPGGLALVILLLAVVAGAVFDGFS